MQRAFSVIAAGAILLAACGDATGPADGTVGVRFAAGRGAALVAGADAVAGLPIAGTNGTLDIAEVWFIVAEFELEGDDDDCPEEDDCNEFDAPPSFLQLPLNGDATPAVRFEPRPGVYDELEFEIERLDDDDDDAAERALLAVIRQRFPDWPRAASVLVTGTFTPKTGAPRPFRTFIDAEIEIELDLVPPVVVSDDAGAEITVELDPRLWFAAGGQVLDLSAYDWQTTRRLLRLEVEIEHGFRGARIER